MTETSNSGWRSFGKFWTTLPGILTAVTAILVGLVSVLGGVRDVVVETQKLFGAVRPSPASATLTTVKASVPDVFPYGLKYSTGLKDFFTWFHVQVQNKTRERLQIEIKFRVNSREAVASNESSIYTVNPGESFSRNVDPNFTFLGDGVPPLLHPPLNVSWTVQDDKGNLLSRDTRDIDVLPRNMIDWGLRSPNGEPVRRDFLVASLAAWTLTADTKMSDRAETLARHVEPTTDAAASARNWFARCYSEFFRSPRAVRIVATRDPLLTQDRQTILTASQVLKEGRATPLEAALLVGALSKAGNRQPGLRLGLLLLPASNQPHGGRITLLWWSTDPGEWQGLDMTRAAELDFRQNEAMATPIIGNCMRERAALRAALDTCGVFFEEEHRILALDFDVAANHYGIGALP